MEPVHSLKMGEQNSDDKLSSQQLYLHSPNSMECAWYMSGMSMATEMQPGNSGSGVNNKEIRMARGHLYMKHHQSI